MGQLFLLSVVLASQVVSKHVVDRNYARPTMVDSPNSKLFGVREKGLLLAYLSFVISVKVPNALFLGSTD